MIYLDYSANTPADPAVLDAYVAAERRYIANPNSTHIAGQEARAEMERVTTSIANHLGVQPAEIIYTSGASEANNLAIKGIAQASRHIGKHIISTQLEHSSIGAALFSTASGFLIIPHLSIHSYTAGLKQLPEVIFELEIPQIMSVMSALVFSVMIGLAATWTKAKLVTGLLDEFQKIVLALVSRIIIPILPLFIGSTFCGLAYEGTITRQLPVFLEIIVLVLAGHFIWMALLYILAGIYSGENPLEVVRHYAPAYLTAVGTMSSAATLAVALQCASRAKPLRKDLVNFGIPLFANIHLCGSVLTEVFFCMAVSKILYGSVPTPGTMVLFCLLLGVFAIGAPGVPGGTVMASLGIITGVLKFDSSGTALMLTIFALQDSFGTACNVTGDGALTLMLTGYAKRHNIEEQNIDIKL